MSSSRVIPVWKALGLPKPIRTAVERQGDEALARGCRRAVAFIDMAIDVHQHVVRLVDDAPRLSDAQRATVRQAVASTRR
jgi:hypothetical protein